MGYKNFCPYSVIYTKPDLVKKVLFRININNGKLK